MDRAQPFRMYGTAPRAESSSLVVGWSEDAGRMGAGVIGYLVEKLGGGEFGEIEPEGFFSLAGVSVEEGTARFPESKFYWCPDRSLAIFMSSPPRSDWYRFLDAVLDVAEHHCGAKAVYAIGGMVYLGSHTTSRQLLAIANSPETREVLAEYDLALDINYESPQGQRPSLNAFLLWVAQKRGIGGISLWVPVPFYMVNVEDPKAWIRALEFLDRRLNLELELGDLEETVLTQDTRIAQLRNRSPDIDKCIRRLEGNLSLSEAESEMLANEVQQFLGRSD